MIKNSFLNSTVQLVGLLIAFLNLNLSTHAATKKDPLTEVDQSVPKKIKGYELVWSDEFNTNGKPNPLNWGYEYGFVRNNELQWYQSQNAICQDGRLVISAKKEKIENPNYNPNSKNWRTNRKYAHYSSSCMITKGNQEWNSGTYFEIRARIDSASGSWPAIWLLGTEGNWPHNGEIDVMEFYRPDGTPSILANACWGTEVAYRGAWDTEIIPLENFTQNDPEWCRQYHIWSMQWDDSFIRLYIDQQLVNEIDVTKTINPNGVNPFQKNKKFYLLLNLAIGSNGGDPSPSKFPITFELDYVRVYQTVD